MVVLLTFFGDGEYGFSTVGVGAILGNGCGIQGKNYVELLQGSEMTAGFHNMNWILGIYNVLGYGLGTSSSCLTII